MRTVAFQEPQDLEGLRPSVPPPFHGASRLLFTDVYTKFISCAAFECPKYCHLHFLHQHFQMFHVWPFKNSKCRYVQCLQPYQDSNSVMYSVHGVSVLYVAATAPHFAKNSMPSDHYVCRCGGERCASPIPPACFKPGQLTADISCHHHAGQTHRFFRRLGAISVTCDLYDLSNPCIFRTNSAISVSSHPGA